MKIKSQRIVDIIRVRDAFNYIYVCQLYLRPGELKKKEKHRSEDTTFLKYLAFSAVPAKQDQIDH